MWLEGSPFIGRPWLVLSLFEHVQQRRVSVSQRNFCSTVSVHTDTWLQPLGTALQHSAVFARSHYQTCPAYRQWSS